MQKFIFTCTCGHEIPVQAADRKEAVDKMKIMMDEKAIKQHMEDMHPGEPIVSVGEMHAAIEKSLMTA
ncbi:MAG: hypothetical protein Q8Q39_01390 [bacterium]|nr:hypothetical protein [bacterium]